MFAAQVILGLFAAAWAIAGLAFYGTPPALLAVPAVVSILAALPGLAKARQMPPPSPDRWQHVRRLVRRWSTVEGLAIAAAVVALRTSGQIRFAPAVIAIIVGLHFVPLARGLPERTYLWTAAALMLLGAAGLAAPAPFAPGVLGLCGAVILWLTMLARPGRAVHG